MIFKPSEWKITTDLLKHNCKSVTVSELFVLNSRLLLLLKYITIEDIFCEVTQTVIA